MAVTLVGILATTGWLLQSNEDQDQTTTSSQSHDMGVSGPSSMGLAIERKASTGPPQGVVERRQKRNFPVMRGSAEEMPSGMGAHIAATFGAAANSLDLRSAQRLSAPGGGIWIVNGRKITCIAQRAFACTGAADFAVRGLVIGAAKSSTQASGHPRDFHIVGLAPSWVDTVQVMIGTRRIQRIPTQGGVYAMDSKVPIFVVGFCKGPHRNCRPLRAQTKHSSD